MNKLNKQDFEDLCTCSKRKHSGLCVKQLKTYQHSAINFALTDKKVGLWLDLGMGKSSSALTTCAILLQNFKVERILVIAPKLIAQTTWDTEAKKWCHTRDLTVAVGVGTKSDRIAALTNTRADIVVVNRDIVVWMIKEFYGIKGRSQGDKFPFDAVILDESSSFKNYTSKRSMALRLISEPLEYMIQLTGTPAPQGYIDLYSQMELIERGMLAPNLNMYVMTYFNQLPTRAIKLKEGADTIIDTAIKPHVMSMKAKDYLGATERRDIVVKIPMSKKDAKLYQEFSKELVLDGLRDLEIIAVNKGVLSSKLRQFCSGLVYDNQLPPVAERVNTLKIDALKELLADNADNVAIVYNFKFEFEDIVSILPKNKWGDGKNSDDIKRFMAGELQYLLLHPQSASMGLNLQSNCHRMIWYSPTWNLEESLQMDGRIDRQGQEQVCIFHRLAVGDIEAKIAKNVSNKDVVMQAMLESVKYQDEGADDDDDDDDDDGDEW